MENYYINTIFNKNTQKYKIFIEIIKNDYFQVSNIKVFIFIKPN